MEFPSTYRIRFSNRRATAAILLKHVRVQTLKRVLTLEQQRPGKDFPEKIRSCAKAKTGGTKVPGSREGSSSTSKSQGYCVRFELRALCKS